MQNFEVPGKLDSSDVLFVGIGRSAVAWYRICLPAIYLGCDWIGVDDHVNYVNGVVRGGTMMPDFNDYKIIVWQQPRSHKAREIIRKLRKQGKIVLIDCDDYLEGVRRQKDHDFRNEKPFSKKEMELWRKTMEMDCDGMILSTEWLQHKYAKHNPNNWVCKNGLDMGRYHKHRAPHPNINIGWCGATGHIWAFGHVLDALQRIMEEHEEVNFISIGQGFADELKLRGIDDARIISMPFTSIELYPNGMTLFDIALAPARPTNWYKAKSALRYYEAAAVGACTIGDSLVYDEIMDGVTGLKVVDQDDWYPHMKRLVTDHSMRLQLQRNAKSLALRDFDMMNRRHAWANVFAEVANTLL